MYVFKRKQRFTSIRPLVSWSYGRTKMRNDASVQGILLYSDTSANELPW